MDPSAPSDSAASAKLMAASANANANANAPSSAANASTVASVSYSGGGGEQKTLSFGYGLPPIADAQAVIDQYRAAMPYQPAPLGGPQPPFMSQYGPPFANFMTPTGWYALGVLFSDTLANNLAFVQ